MSLPVIPDRFLVFASDAPRRSYLDAGTPWGWCELKESDISYGANTALVTWPYHKAGFLEQGAVNWVVGPAATAKSANIRPVYVVVRTGAKFVVYSITLMFGQTLVALRAGELKQASGAGLELLGLATRLHLDHEIALSNQDAYYSKYHPDNEIEYKLNLAVPSPIWDLAKHFHEQIQMGELPGFVLQPLDPFNQWEFHNYLFEVTDPADQRGYISFITCPNKEYVIKQKIYAADTLERIERRTKNIRLTSTMPHYLAEHYPKLKFRELAPFTRRRYDVNFESLETGNIYSIMFDHCWIIGTPTHQLSQCEVEYLKTRSVFPPVRVEEELKTAYNFVKSGLGQQDVQYEETFYSKLSFLRDFDILASKRHLGRALK